MKPALLLSLWANLAVACLASEPLRVAVLDFEDQTGLKSDEKLGGAIAPGALAQKGFVALAKNLLDTDGFVAIDRRDFIGQIERSQPTDMGTPTTSKPSFLLAARNLRADAILRGTLLSFSTAKERIHQGGYATDFSTVTLRVALEALDVRDGAVIAVSDGSATRKFRQTDALSTQLGEDDAYELLEEATRMALTDVTARIAERQAEQAERPTVKLSIKTTEDPALIELDGLLIGSSPITDLEVYAGDHVLSITKPGYPSVTKRILLEKNTYIEVPMLRESLTAEEKKQVLDGADIDIVDSDLPGLIIKTTD